MKKIPLTVTIVCFACIATARDNGDGLIDRGLARDIFNISAMVLVLYLITSFILKLIQQNLDYRLKNKIVDKGVNESITAQLLSGPEKDLRKVMLQWFFVLAGIGAGFGFISITRPFGIHSLAIMALSIAAGFGGYYLATRKPRS
jgi:hypothetical protein